MRKYAAILLCAASLCAFSVTAFASDVFSYSNDDWKAIYGVSEPSREDFEDSGEYAAAWNAWYSGLSDFIVQTTQAEYARQAAEDQKPVSSTPTKSFESAGTNNGSRNSSMENDTPDKYPVGSYVDPDGIVWSPDGSRLSPIPAPELALDPFPDENPPVSPDVLADTDLSAAGSDLDTLAVIAELVSDIASDSPVWYVEDLRPADTPVTVLEGLKALVTSVFGEYTPVTTTSVVTETVGNETYQYLVETVAPGAAGVDYEWIAGVFLFGIMLFCFMKLLGGILK